MEVIHSFYEERLSGQTIPIWFSAIRELDYDSDESIYLAVKLEKAASKKSYDYAYLELPVASCGRFILLPEKETVTSIDFTEMENLDSLPDGWVLSNGSGSSGLDCRDS